MRINTNLDALDAQMNLSMTSTAYSKSVEKLSSGLRINRAADDAAGLTISQKLTAQVNGTQQATRNAQDGISMIQTAEGALNEVQSMLQRMNELAVQSANDTLGATDRTAINSELQQLSSEINAISSRTTFNGQSLLTGSLVTAQDPTSTALVGKQINTTGGNSSITGVDVSGAKAGDTFTLTSASAGTLTLTRSSDNTAQTISTQAVAANGTETLDFSNLGVSLTVNTDGAGKTAAGLATDLASLTVKTQSGSGSANLQIGADASDSLNIAFTRVDVSASGLSGLNTALSNYNTTQSVSNSQALITAVQSAIDSVSGSRSTYGAYQNRLEHTINSLNVAAQNLTASNSQIQDVDMASEMVNFTKLGIMQQAGQAVLAQANHANDGVIQLLRG
jgi:flagellin